MNYLAHALLSPADDQILTGNLLGDFVRSLDGLSPGLQQGVLVHRRIDSATNVHPAFRRSVRRLAEESGHYASVIVDVFYDHLLARNFEFLSGGRTLLDFVAEANARFQRVRHCLPDDLPVRWEHVNWLAGYASTEGVVRSLARLSRRSRRGTDLTRLLPAMMAQKKGLLEDLEVLLPDLMQDMT